MRLRVQNSHSVATNSTKITATKATPSLLCFSGLDFMRCGDPGVRGGQAALSSSRLIAAFEEAAGGGGGSFRPGRAHAISCKARLLHRRVLSLPVGDLCEGTHMCKGTRAGTCGQGRTVCGGHQPVPTLCVKPSLEKALNGSTGKVSHPRRPQPWAICRAQPASPGEQTMQQWGESRDGAKPGEGGRCPLRLRAG